MINWGLPALLIGLSFLLAVAVTYGVLSASSRVGLEDRSTDRSLHNGIVPTGGGLGLVAACLGTALVALLIPIELGTWSWLTLFTAAALAALGLLDDQISLSPLIRLLAQLLMTMFTVVILAEPLGFPFSVLGVLWATFLVGAGVWWLNLFNFMDGSDGLATSQASLIFGGVLVLLLVEGHEFFPGFGLFVVVALAALAGFSFFNLPPAKIFMGDVGSLFLAQLLLANGASVAALTETPVVVLSLLGAPFIWDASITLILRLRRREKVWQAHREHVYQQYIVKRQVSCGRTQAHWEALFGLLAIQTLIVAPTFALCLNIPNNWAVGTALLGHAVAATTLLALRRVISKFH